MKFIRFFLFVIAGVLVLTAEARQTQLDRVSEAFNEGDMVTAQKLIGKAVTQKTFMFSTRAWFEYGRVYKAIATGVGTEKVLMNEEAAMEEAIRAFNKAIEIGPKGDAYYNLARQSLSALWGEFVNQGANAFQDKRMEEAIVHFDRAKRIKPQDTTAYLYAGIAAQSLERSTVVLDNFSKLAEIGVNDTEVYKSLIYYTQKLGQDTLMAIRQARERFPADGDFLRLEINHHMYSGDEDSALSLLEGAIEHDPGNPQLLFNLGYLNESLGRLPDAVAGYNRAIEVDPRYYEPSYNVSVIYYNQAISTLNQLVELPDEEYEAKAPSLRAEGEEGLKSALPFVMKCTELRPTARSNWETLIVIYDRLGMKPEMKAAQIKLKGLTN
jgi:tetratricopeptide (TPR) repeat protein